MDGKAEDIYFLSMQGNQGPKGQKGEPFVLTPTLAIQYRVSLYNTYKWNCYSATSLYLLDAADGITITCMQRLEDDRVWMCEKNVTFQLCSPDFAVQSLSGFIKCSSFSFFSTEDPSCKCPCYLLPCISQLLEKLDVRVPHNYILSCLHALLCPLIS